MKIQSDFFVNNSHAVAYGEARGHVGEFLQGAIDSVAERMRILVSIPSPQLMSQAAFFPEGRSALCVEPAWKQKSLASFQLGCRTLGVDAPYGLLRMNGNIPVARGLGSSTADCTAAIRAAFAWAHAELSNDRLAGLVHQVERFSDASMYGDELVVFRHDAGVALERLPGPSPHFRMVLVEAVGEKPAVLTEALARPVYSAEEMRLFAKALHEMRRALLSHDAVGIASVAELSASINQRYLPQLRRSELQHLVRASGALGLGATHSGDLQVVLFANDPTYRQKRDFVIVRLADIGLKMAAELRSYQE